MSESEGEFSTPPVGEWIRLGTGPEADSNWLWGEVIHTGIHGDGKHFAMVRYTNLNQSSYEDVVVWDDGFWGFPNRGFKLLPREWKAILETSYAQWRKARPKA